MSTPDTNERNRWPRFFTGFVVSLLLLALFSCGSLGAVLGLNRQSLTALQGAANAWAPPAVPPTSTPAAQGPANLAGDRFAAEALVRNVTNSRVNLRRTPGYLGKSNDDVLTQTRPGDTMQILGDSARADGLTWWRIRYTRDGEPSVEGWVAEATASGMQILGPAEPESGVPSE